MTASATYEEALGSCGGEGAHLATFRTQEEFEQLIWHAGDQKFLLGNLIFALKSLLKKSAVGIPVLKNVNSAGAMTVFGVAGGALWSPLENPDANVCKTNFANCDAQLV